MAHKYLKGWQLGKGTRKVHYFDDEYWEGEVSLCDDANRRGDYLVISDQQPASMGADYCETCVMLKGGLVDYEDIIMEEMVVG